MISIVVNLDSRAGVDSEVTKFEGHNEGTRSWDFFTEGLVNKLRFFNEFETELIVFVDEHERVPDEVLLSVRAVANCIVLRRHTKKYRNHESFGCFNDVNYLHALFQARGDIIAHLDADTVVLARDATHVQSLLTLLFDGNYGFVSYPSKFSPAPVLDGSFGRHTWASTRFFLCRRETLKFDVLERALRDPEWVYDAYGHPARKCPWLEHFLALTNYESVIYPPPDYKNLMIFCWDRYRTGVLQKINEGTFDQAHQYVVDCGGIHYPNDVTAK